jgi:hypothetical protein
MLLLVVIVLIIVTLMFLLVVGVIAVMLAVAIIIATLHMTRHVERTVHWCVQVSQNGSTRLQQDGQVTHLKIDPSRVQDNYSIVAVVPVNITGRVAGIIVGLRVSGWL